MMITYNKNFKRLLFKKAVHIFWDEMRWASINIQFGKIWGTQCGEEYIYSLLTSSLVGRFLWKNICETNGVTSHRNIISVILKNNTII